MFDSPTQPELAVYEALSDRAIDPVVEELKHGLSRELEALSGRFEAFTREALRTAYMRGVRDGFVQGVQTQADSVKVGR